MESKEVISQNELSLAKLNQALHQRVDELEAMLGKLLNQSKQTSQSMRITGRRLFRSDDFMMVWDEAQEVLEDKVGNSLKKQTITLANEDILGAISRTYPDMYCVFIQPGGITDAVKDREALNLDCDNSSLYAEDLILETFNCEETARRRVYEFNGKWAIPYGVSGYHDGEFLGENHE